MTDAEREAMAGEYALGLLDEAGEAAARDLMRTDAGFAGEVARWQAALTGLAGGLSPVDPPPRVRAAVMGEVGGAEPRRVPPPPRGSTRLWKAVAATLAVVSLGELALLLSRPEPETVVRRVPAEAPPEPLVAALVPTDAAPPILVSLDVPQGVLTVDPSGLEAGDRAVQLWLLPPGGGAPVSLGLLAPNTDNTVEVPLALAGLDPDLLPSLAISLEPEGGSPTGAPTGPVVAAGAVRPLTE